jgi:hypothetical protein
LVRHYSCTSGLSCQIRVRPWFVVACPSSSQSGHSSLSVEPSLVIALDFLTMVPHQDALALSLWLLVMYVGRSIGLDVGIMAVAPARTIVGIHTMGPISPSNTII